MKEFLSLNEVARLLKIPSYRITYALTSGSIPEPTIRFINRRCFTAEDVELIAKHFGVVLPASDHVREGKP